MSNKNQQEKEVTTEEGEISFNDLFYIILEGYKSDSNVTTEFKR